MIKGVQTRVDSEINPIALIENAEAIQAAIMHMIDAVLKGTIDNKRANIVLKALYIAVRNSRNVYFHIRTDDMVREVPNYAHQCLTEHPELNANSHPDAIAPQPEDNKARGDLQESAAQPPTQAASAQPQLPAFATAPKKESHPERARTLRESKDPHSANRGNGAPGTSPRSSEANRQKAWGENIPPLTTRQAERWNEIKKLEASIEGAMRGDWRELRTVFSAVGLIPPKPPSCQRAAPNRQDGLSPGAEKADPLLRLDGRVARPYTSKG